MTTRARASAPADALLTDLYQLSMLQAYWDHGLTESATFDLFCRRLPPHRNLLIACGLEAALDHLERAGRHGGGPGVPGLAGPLFQRTSWTGWSDSGSRVRCAPCRRGRRSSGTSRVLEVTAELPEAQDRGDVSAQRHPSPDHGRVRRVPPGGCRQGHAGCRLRHAARARRGSRRGYRSSGLHRGHGGYLERGGWASVWRAC